MYLSLFIFYPIKYAMPYSTFIKLKLEKRQRITDIALRAFALQDYEAVSITRLMQELALPKGSFYQYFEDKKDLYFYLFEHFQQKKETITAQYVSKTTAHFFDFWEELLVGELQYHWENPVEWSFWLNAHRERNSLEIGNLQMLILQRMAQQLLGTLRQESKHGYIRQDLNIELSAYFFAQTGDAITQFILHKYNLNLAENIRESKTLPAFPTIEVRIVVSQWLAMLKRSVTTQGEI